MNISQHNNLIQLTRLLAFNCFFVVEDDGLTLVDTNLPGSADAIMEAAAGRPIKRVVLTHPHSDHVASVDALVAKLDGVEIIASARSVPMLAGEVRLEAGEPDDKLRGGYTTIETKVTREVNDGDTVGSLRVIAAPGHTPGHIALLDTRDNTLIAGDALVPQWGPRVSGQMNWLFPFPALATWHKPTALDTVKKLRALEPSAVAVGHGPILTDPLPTIDSAIRAAEAAFKS